MNEVAENLCAERMKIMDERFSRDRERLEKIEESMETVAVLSVQMGELIKRYDERCGRFDSTIRTHGERIAAIEQRPGRLWDKLLYALFGGAVSLCVSLLLTLLA